jgi:hypothetical protein
MRKNTLLAGAYSAVVIGLMAAGCMNAEVQILGGDEQIATGESKYTYTCSGTTWCYPYNSVNDTTSTGGQWSFTATKRSSQTNIKYSHTKLKTLYESYMNTMLVNMTGHTPARSRISWGANNAETVSEGMGYGVTLAAIFDDQTTLKNLTEFIINNVDEDGLMNWKIRCSSSSSTSCALGTNGQGAAPDAEMDYLYGWQLACTKVGQAAWASGTTFTVPGPYGGTAKSYCDLVDIFGRRSMESFIDRHPISPATEAKDSSGNYNGGVGCAAGSTCVVKGGELMAGDEWTMKAGVTGSGPGDLVFNKGIVNISYFDPGLLRAWGVKWNNPTTCPAGGESATIYPGWCKNTELDRVIDRNTGFIKSMQTQQIPPSAAAGQEVPSVTPTNCSGLVFQWNDYNAGCTAVPWQGNDSCKWSYDAARTAYRLARDVLWFPTVNGVTNPSRALVEPMGDFFSNLPNPWEMGPCDMGGKCSSGGVFFPGNAMAAIIVSQMNGGLSTKTCGSATGTVARTAQEHFNYLNGDTTDTDYYQSSWKLFGMLLASGQMPRPVAGTTPPATDSCTDGVKNVPDETDIDCGGQCQKCVNGKTCSNGSDCLSGTCTSGVCVVASVNQCTNGTKDANEAGVDCGGPCAACPATCSDGVLNQAETDIDCGGACTNKCTQDKYCESDSDCATGLFCRNGTNGSVSNRTCKPQSCTDMIKNQDETGVDCGGSSCAACPPDQGMGSPLCANATTVLKPGSEVRVEAFNTTGSICYVFNCTPGSTLNWGGAWNVTGRTITIKSGATTQNPTVSGGNATFGSITCGADGKITYAFINSGSGQLGYAGFNAG